MMFLHLLKNRPRQEELPQGSAEALPTLLTDPLARFRTTKEHAITLSDALLGVLTDNLRQGDPALLDEIWRLFPFYIDVVATADFAAARATDVSPPSQEAAPSIDEYLTSSLTLSASVAYLVENPMYERLHLVTG